MQMNTQANQNVARLVTLNSPYLKRVETMEQFRAALDRGTPAILSVDDRSCEIYPAAYEIPEQPINLEIGTAGEWFGHYQAAIRGRKKDAAAEWLDELEALALHTSYDIVRKLIESWLSSVEVPRSWRVN
jgi:hypothetical protein